MLRLTTDCGTTLVRTVIVDRNQLFFLGDVVTTPTVLGALTRTTEDAVATISTLLNRRARGDWGSLDAEDLRTNDEALMGGFRLLSAYLVGTTTVWIITESDRSWTTVLLPSDY